MYYLVENLETNKSEMWWVEKKKYKVCFEISK